MFKYFSKCTELLSSTDRCTDRCLVLMKNVVSLLCLSGADCIRCVGNSQVGQPDLLPQPDVE